MRVKLTDSSTGIPVFVMYDKVGNVDVDSKGNTRLRIMQKNEHVDTKFVKESPTEVVIRLAVGELVSYSSYDSLFTEDWFTKFRMRTAVTLGLPLPTKNACTFEAVKQLLDGSSDSFEALKKLLFA